MVLDFGKSEMVESCYVDVHYRKRLGDRVIYLHLQVLFVGHTADQTRGMFKKPRSLMPLMPLMPLSLPVYTSKLIYYSQGENRSTP